MLRRTELNKISNRLKWDRKDTESAIKELRELSSIIDTYEFLKICVHSEDVDDRFEDVTQFLIDTLKNDPAETISNLLSIDPCFYAMAFFNLFDSLNKLEHELGLDFTIDYKSFINWEYPLNYPEIWGDMLIKKRKEKTIFMEDIIPQKLTYRFLDEYVDHYVRGLNYDLEKIITKVLTEKKLLALNIEYFRWNLCNPFHNNKNLFNQILAISTDPLVSRKEITQGRYWFYYVLVEVLNKRKGYGLRESFRKVAKVLGESANTIQRRYFEKKKQAKTKSLKIDDLIMKHQFQLSLDEVLKKI